MEYPIIKPVYTSTGVECNEKELARISSVSSIKQIITPIDKDLEENKALMNNLTSRGNNPIRLARPVRNKKFAIMHNAFFHQSSQTQKEVCYKKKRLKLTEPKDLQPIIIKDKAKLDDFIKQCTVSNFNNKYNCLLYDNKQSIYGKSNFDDYSKNFKAHQTSFLKQNSLINRNKTTDQPYSIYFLTNPNLTNTRDSSDLSLLTKIKLMSTKRRDKISIDCIKERNQMK